MNRLKEELIFENDNWLSCANDAGNVNDPYQLIDEVMIDSDVNF